MKENLNITDQQKHPTDKAIPFDALVGLPPLQLNEIYNGDSFELCERVPAKTVDLILEDMPYNTTQNKWEYEVDLDAYWKSRKRILKCEGAIILTASQPFTSKLILSNLEMFKYTWTWIKNIPTNFLNAKKQPLRLTEDIIVFYSEQVKYNPKMLEGYYKTRRTVNLQSDNYGKQNHTDKDRLVNELYPVDVIAVDKIAPDFVIHPTQKPISLFRYLIETYTNQNDLVFDGFGGSGTTAIAAHKSKRNFIVIEKEKKYFDLAKRRLENERAQYTML